MANTSSIGLDKKDSKELADKMNQLLANFQVFYINARGFHWNIKGDKFFELHAKFEEIYNDALVKIDEIAERILTIGYTPVHSFTEYVEMSQIKEIKNVSDGKTGLGYILSGYQSLINLEREIHKLAAETDDEGTNSLMSDYLREQEKNVWMFNAYLK